MLTAKLKRGAHITKEYPRFDVTQFQTKTAAEVTEM
jgi:hypothetical protein